jgi:hypothetical protein
MHDLNSALDALREVMPYAHGPSVRKLSKIATLLLAKNYILMLNNSLQELRKLVPPEVYQVSSSQLSVVGPTAVPGDRDRHPATESGSASGGGCSLQLSMPPLPDKVSRQQARLLSFSAALSPANSEVASHMIGGMSPDSRTVPSPASSEGRSSTSSSSSSALAFPLSTQRPAAGPTMPLLTSSASPSPVPLLTTEGMRRQLAAGAESHHLLWNPLSAAFAPRSHAAEATISDATMTRVMQSAPSFQLPSYHASSMPTAAAAADVVSSHHAFRGLNPHPFSGGCFAPSLWSTALTVGKEQ